VSIFNNLTRQMYSWNICFRCDFSREWCWWRVLFVGLLLFIVL